MMNQNIESKHEGIFSAKSLVVLPLAIEAPSKDGSQQNKEANLGAR